MVILELFATVQLCAIHSPWSVNMGIEIEKCTENNSDPTTLINCFVQILDNLPEDVVGALEILATNPSATEPDFMVFVVESLESNSESELENMYPGSDWCCILVASMQLSEQSMSLLNMVSIACVLLCMYYYFFTYLQLQHFISSAKILTQEKKISLIDFAVMLRLLYRVREYLSIECRQLRL